MSNAIVLLNSTLASPNFAPLASSTSTSTLSHAVPTYLLPSTTSSTPEASITTSSGHSGGLSHNQIVVAAALVGSFALVGGVYLLLYFRNARDRRQTKNQTLEMEGLKRGKAGVVDARKGQAEKATGGKQASAFGNVLSQLHLDGPMLARPPPAYTQSLAYSRSLAYCCTTSPSRPFPSTS
ncbi:hypothetical protein JCM10207_004175 [Rhodosporidiobolus poonsookiae]